MKVEAAVGGDPSDRTSPTLVGSGWTWVSAGEDHTCGLQQAALYCWGNGLFGRLGNGRADQPRVPAPTLVEAEGWQAVAAGGTHSCGIRNGAVFCWGSDLQGQAGLGGGGIFAAPTEVRTR